MYSFRRFGQSNDPWFRIGTIDVSTTLFIAGLAVISMFVWAGEGRLGPIFRTLWLISDNTLTGSVVDGQIWRLFTWPVPNEPDFWSVLLIVIFVMIGTQVESLMTRRPYAWFVAALVVIPAVVVTILEVVFDVRGAASGLRFLELGILAAFAAQYPKAVFWPGIPAWVIAAVIIGIDYLQILGDRDDYGFAMLTSTVVVALVGLRSFGHAESLPQIPRVPLPAFVTGTITTSPAARRRSKPSRGRRPLRSVPGPDDDRRAEMEIDALLDQVASHGLESLTKAQRKRLEQHSRDLRRRRDQG